MSVTVIDASKFKSSAVARKIDKAIEEDTGRKAFANHLKPRKGRVVALSSPSGSIYRLNKGLESTGQVFSELFIHGILFRARMFP